MCYHCTAIINYFSHIPIIHLAMHCKIFVGDVTVPVYLHNGKLCKKVYSFAGQNKQISNSTLNMVVSPKWISKAVPLLWIIYVISVLFSLCLRAHLFMDALWSPAVSKVA